MGGYEPMDEYDDSKPVADAVEALHREYNEMISGGLDMGPDQYDLWMGSKGFRRYARQLFADLNSTD